MTFEEWWKSKKTLIETVVNNNKSHIDLIVFIKSIMNIAWDTSQPKWTYCKDGMPEEDIDSLVLQHNSFQPLNLLVEDKFNGEIRVVQGVYHFRIPCFATDDGEVIVHDGIAENDELEVLAWMPLPEAPDNIV